MKLYKLKRFRATSYPYFFKSFIYFNFSSVKSSFSTMKLGISVKMAQTATGEYS